MSAVLDCALILAQQKVKFFPVRHDSKLPAVADFSAKATSDPDELRRMFAGTNFNSGIACGKITEGLYLVGFDIDNKGGRNGFDTLDLLAELGQEFPATWAQKTPSGGEHRLFWSPIPIRQGTNVCGEGIDFRGDGGYLVGPASTIFGIPYSILVDLPIAKFPDWAIAKFQKLATITKIKTSVTKGTPAQNQVLALKKSVEYLQQQDATREGARNNDGYKHAAKLKDLGLEKSQIVDVLAEHWKCEPALNIEELAFVVDNTFSYTTNPQGIEAPENLFPIVREEDPADSTPIQEMNKNFFYYAANGVSKVCWETKRKDKFHLERFPVHIFHEKHLSKTIEHNGRQQPLTKVWMASEERRTYDNMLFNPAGDVEEGAYNTWKGFAVSTADVSTIYPPQAHEGLKLFLEHVEQNVCKGDKDLTKWLLNYMAHLFQYPGEKPEVSLVFKGKKGTGKTIISVILDHLIGDNSVILSDKAHVLGHFNSMMEDKMLVTLDEAFWSGDKGIEGILKDLITGGTRVITHKGAEPYKARVFDRIIIIGNEDWLVPATSDERRFAVFNFGESKQQDRRFFGALRSGLLKSGGDRLLMQYFMQYPVDCNEVNIAPETEGLNEQKQHSLPVFHQWWFSCLQEGQILGSGVEGWPANIIARDLYDAFSVQMSSERKFYPPTRIGVGMIFKHIAPSCHRTNKGNIRRYDLPDLTTCRQDWDTVMRFKTNWE